MQQVLKTLLIFSLIMSITPTRLSNQNKGIGSFLSKVGNKVDEFVTKIAMKIIAASLRGVIFSTKAADAILKFTEGDAILDELNPISWIFRTLFNTPQPKTTWKFYVFLPVSIITMIIGVLQAGTGLLLEYVHKALTKHLDAVDDRIFEYEFAEQQLKAAISKKTKELQEVVIARSS